MVIRVTALLSILSVAVLALVLLPSAEPAYAATFTVDSAADEPDAAPGDGRCATASGTCTLRAAVQEAHASEGADTIALPAGTYIAHDLDLTGDLTIMSEEAGSTVIISSADGATRTNVSVSSSAGHDSSGSSSTSVRINSGSSSSSGAETRTTVSTEGGGATVSAGGGRVHVSVTTGR